MCSYGITIAMKEACLQSSTAARAFPAGRVGGDGGDVFDSANLETGAGQSSKSGLGTRTRGLSSVATSGSHLDVHGGDTKVLHLGGSIHGGKHGSVRGSLISVSLDLHATGHSAKGLSAGQIGDVLKENAREKKTWKRQD